MIEGAVPVANGRDLMVISTSELVDQFGNPLPDGTIGHLEASGATGQRRLTSRSIDSRLRFVLEAPSEPGRTELQAFASGGESKVLTIEFEPAVAEIPITVTAESELSRISVGRVTEPDGGFVPDGTLVKITSDGNLYNVELEDGFVSIVVPTAFEVEVTILGRSALPGEAK